MPLHLESRPRSALLVLALTASAAVGTASPASAAEPGGGSGAPAYVTVVHGLRGLVADVEVDGTTVLTGFAPERTTEPLALAAGKHRVELRRTGAPAGSAPVLATDVDLPAGARLSAAVGLDAAGRPALSTYDDSRLPVRAGGGGIAVRTVAQAQRVRPSVDGTVLGVVRGAQQQVRAVAAGQHAVTVLPESGTEPLVPTEQVPVQAGRVVVLYVIGSAQSGLGLLAQTVRPAAAAAAAPPDRIDTGVGPVPTATGDTSTVAGTLALGAALLLGVAGGARTRAGRRCTR